MIMASYISSGELLYTVIVPVYNEAENVRKFMLTLRKHAKDILVVDDGSSDGSAGIAKSTGVRVIEHGSNMGKGAAVLTGIKAAKTEDIILIDGDGQFSPSEIPLFIKKLKECDLVLGNRFHEGLEMPFHRLVANKLLKFLLSRNFGAGDPLIGFRALKRSKFLELHEKGFEHDLEMIFLAREKGLKVCEVPVSVTYKIKKSSSLSGVMKKFFYYAKLLYYALRRAY